MAFSISGSVAFVTGSNRGIGRALVGALLEKGVGRTCAHGQRHRRCSSRALWNHLRGPQSAA